MLCEYAGAVNKAIITAVTATFSITGLSVLPRRVRARLAAWSILAQARLRQVFASLNIGSTSTAAAVPGIRGVQDGTPLREHGLANPTRIATTRPAGKQEPAARGIIIETAGQRDYTTYDR
jgi:hypothetical protein